MGLIASDALNTAVSSVSPGEPLCLNNRVCTVTSLSLQILKQNNTRLENRTQLVTMCHMGPKVFINCAGFIKIDTASLGDRWVLGCVQCCAGCRVSMSDRLKRSCSVESMFPGVSVWPLWSLAKFR